VYHHYTITLSINSPIYNNNNNNNKIKNISGQTSRAQTHSVISKIISFDAFSCDLNIIFPKASRELLFRPVATTSPKDGRGQRPAGPESLTPVQLSVHDGQGESGQGSARTNWRTADGVRCGILPGDE